MPGDKVDGRRALVLVLSSGFYCPDGRIKEDKLAHFIFK